MCYNGWASIYIVLGQEDIHRKIFLKSNFQTYTTHKEQLWICYREMLKQNNKASGR